MGWVWTKRRARKKRQPSVHYLKHREAARALVHARLAHFNEHYGFVYKRVSIKNQKTCWGSCSAQGNLNFNYKLLFLPAHLSDYVIVHELCHLAELNHSKQFWERVAEMCPEYRARRRELRTITVRRGKVVPLQAGARIPYNESVIDKIAV